MSRSINLNLEKKELDALPGDDLYRQYCSRFPIDLARRFIDDCIHEQLQPSRNLMLITSEWYRLIDTGVAFALDNDTKNEVDLISGALGITRNAVVQMALRRALPDLFREASQRLKEKQQAAAAFRKSIE